MTFRSPDSLGKPSIQDVIRKIDRLPQLPEAALRLVKLMEDPDISAHNIAEVVKVDPELTSQVLRLCNSAHYGLRQKVETVQQAVAMIGFKALKSMVYVIISKFALDHRVEGYGLEKGALWYNSLACAVYAKDLAKRIGKTDGEMAFTAALLRDIGKIVIGEYVGPAYQQIEVMAQERQIDFCDAEQQVLGFNHNIVGKQVAEKWALPDYIVKTIQYKNKPSALIGKAEKPEIYPLVSTIHLADAFTRMIGHGVGADGLMYTLDEKAIQDLGVPLTNEYMESTLIRLMEMTRQVDDMIQSLKGEGAAS